MIDPETLFEKHKSIHLGLVSNCLNNFIVSSPPHISRASTILLGQNFFSLIYNQIFLISILPDKNFLMEVL